MDFDIIYRVALAKNPLDLPKVKNSSFSQSVNSGLAPLVQALMFKSELQESKACIKPIDKKTNYGNSNLVENCHKSFKGSRLSINFLDHLLLTLTKESKIMLNSIKNKNSRIFSIKLLSRKSREFLTYFNPILSANKQSNITSNDILLRLSFDQKIPGTAGIFLSRLLPIRIKKKANSYRELLRENMR